MKRRYLPPSMVSERSFETSALACAKGPDGMAGSHHFYSAYDTFTGHFGPGWETIQPGMQSLTGSAGVGFGPGGTSLSYPYDGICINWVTLNS